MKKVNNFLFNSKMIKKKCFNVLVLSLLSFLMMVNYTSYGQILWSSSGGSAWLTGSNWTGSAVPTSAQIAQFGANPTAATGVGINGNSSAASFNTGTQGSQDVGAIEVTSARAAAFLVGNSSTSAGKNVIITFYGTSVNGVANTILRNNSTQTFTLQNTQSTGNQLTTYTLANTTANIVNIDGTGNIVITSPITGSSKKLSLNANSSGDLRLSGSNSWSGGTDIAGSTSGGRLRIDSLASLPTTGTIAITTGGRITLNFPGTYGGVSQSMTFNPNQITNPSLDILSGAAVIWQGTITISAATRIEANGASGSLTFSGNATGAGTLIKQAAGNLILSGTANTLTGGTQIGNGKLTVNSGSSMGTDTIVLFQTATNNDTISLNNTAQTIGGLVSRFTATTGTQSQVIILGSGHTLTINQSYNSTFGTGAVSTLTSTIAGSGNLIKSGAGTLTLSSANTYTGTTTISGGTLALGIAKALSSSSNITLNGGTLSTTGAFSQKVGTLNLNSKSTIALFSGVHSDTFLASNGVSWAGDTLFVTGWTGTAGSSGTGGKIFVGTTSSGLTTGQLAKIIFVGYSGPATILSTGEVVPSNPTPVITVTGTTKVISTIYGTASAQDTINVSGTGITGGIFISAPTGFEVSKTSGSGFKAIDTISGSGTITSTRVYYRLKATTTPATYRDTLVVTSSGATTVKATTAFDTVRTKVLTISGLTGNNKVYDATTTATLSGTPTLAGINFSDTVTVGGSPSSSFATASIGTGKAITITGYTLGGAQAAYYTLTQPSLTANITAKALTISGLSGVSRVYDATTTATLSGTPTLVGVITSDTSNVILGGSASASFATATAGTGKAITVTGYSISGSASGNYSLTQPAGLTADITQATQTITFGSLANKIVGDPNFSLTATASSGLPVSYSSSVPSVASVSGSTVTVGVAGTTVITASQAGDVNYQAATSVNQNQVVDTAVLLAQTITFGTLSAVTYGDAPFALTATASSGLTVSYTSSNTSVATVSGSTVTIIAPGTTTITASQPGNSTYAAATNVLQSLTVNVKTLTISGASASSKVYDRTNSATITGGSLVGIVGSDTVTFSGSGTFSDANVGTGKTVTGALVLAGAQAARYTLTQPSLTANITAKNLTISGLTGNNKAYDGTTTASLSGSPSLSGIIAPDVVTISGSPSSSFATSAIGTGISITVTGYTLSGADAGNYSVTQPTGLTGNITAITLTISGLTGDNKVYDRNTTATLSGTPSLVGVLAADVSNVILGGSPSSSFATSAVGTGKTITTTGYSISGSAAGNYTLTQPAATANITAKALTVTGATASSKTYDATTSATITGGSLVGIISPDVVTFSGGGTFADANIGTAKTVTAALVLGGADAGNYSITQPILSADINAKNLTISGRTGNNKVYDATTAATLSGTATLVGVIAADVSNVTLGGTPAATFATSSIGTGIAITVTGYTISGSASGNYTLTQPTGLTANITAKALTISGLTGDNKVYDRNTTATLSGTPSLVGVIAADVSNVILGGSPSSTFATATVGTAKTITTTGYSISGSASGNYTLSQPSASADITKKALTVTGATASNKTYDATTTATITGGSLVGIISPDIVTLGGGGTFADANVGTAKPVTAALTLGGADGGNYSITQPTGLTANITKANQTITFSALASKTTSDAPFSLTATASSGLTVTYASANGSVATVSGSTLTINGAGTSNITASQAGDANWNAATDVVQAQVVTQGPIAAWDVTGYSSGGVSPAAESEKNSHVTVTGLTRGSGLSTATASSAWGASGFDGPTTSAGAISSNKFATFVITPESGYSMSLSSIPTYNIRRSSTGPANGLWQYKIGSGSFVDIGSAFSYGSGTTSAGNTQSAVTLSGISALQNVSSAVTFRLVSFSSPTAGSTGTWYINTQGAGNDFQVNGTVQFQCASPTKLTFTTQPTTLGGNINQGASFNVVVSAVCEDGNVASGLNSGSVTLDFSGCGLNSGVTYPGNTKTANFVGGVATFSNLSVSRSTQSSVYFTTSNTASLRDTTSNTFNIVAPSGSTTHDTLKNDNFSARTIAWNWTTGTASTVGSGGSAGSDVSGITTISGNSFFRKSYSVNNGSGERGTTNTYTFDNVTGLSSYNTTDFTFKVGSSIGLSGTGVGNDANEDFTLQLSTDGGGTYTTILTHLGNSNKVFPFSSSSTYTLSPTSNTTFSGSSSQSSYKVTLPSGTSQVRFRITATNNRSEESWCLDDLMLIGHIPSGGVQSVLPTVSIVGGDIICGPPYSATLSSSLANSVGPISYRWSPGSSLADSTVASPVASPTSPTSYSLVATDSVGCIATSGTPATVNFPTPEIILVNTTTTSSGYCDAADGFRYYQVPGSSPAEYFFAINWDADHDGIIDAAAKAASTVTVTVLGSPFSSTATSNEHGSVLMKRYWDVDIASSSMSEPVDVKFYYDGTEKTAINAIRDANKAAAALLTPYALHDVPFAWFKTVGTPMNSSILSMINGNDYSAFPSIGLVDANTGAATDGSILYARFNTVMSFSGGTGGVGFAPYSGVALPIELLSFTATPFNNQVNLNWSTATEINNDYFTIERSQDGVHFESILTKKGAGNSTTTLTYRAEDKAPYEGISYYRLKQTDLDGQYSYSMIRSVDINATTPILITHYPNPIAETVRFEYTTSTATQSTYVIYDATGNMVYSGTTATQPGANNFELNLSKLSSGVYIIKMDIDGSILTDKFLKQ